LANKIFGAQGNRCHRETGISAKDKAGELQSFFGASAQKMNWSSKAIWYTDEGYEIQFASDRNWISYGPDGWVHLAISLHDAKQMCDSQEKVRTDKLGPS
jgi:hypothetical protein